MIVSHPATELGKKKKKKGIIPCDHFNRILNALKFTRMPMEDQLCQEAFVTPYSHCFSFHCKLLSMEQIP